jgi:predicted membrane-bound spermidine synthase
LPRISSSPTLSAAASATVRWPQIYLGLGFTTLATLMLELALTRIFSVVFYYHFAFLTISIALFGLGAGGVFSYVVAGLPGTLYWKLGTLALANSVCVVASLWFVLSLTGDLHGPQLAAVYFASALPFFLAGAIVSLAISEAIERVDRAYFFDLAGAAAGCLLLIKFLDWFGGPTTIVATGVFYAIAAAIWFNLAGSTMRRATAVLTSLLLVALMVVNQRISLLDIRSAKGEALPRETFVAWNSFSRVGVGQEGSLNRLRIVIDANAATSIASFDWDRLTAADRAQLLYDGPGFPYLVRPGAKALIIGAGGGYDVARALASGSRDITAVEINPIIAQTIMREKFVRESRGLYFRPEVRVVVEDGRSFVRGSREKYQVVQATLVDTWASTAAGAFALSENNLYTTDAFYDYLTHLTDDGLLAFTRWGFDPPRESLRLLSLAVDAFGRLGEPSAWQHVMVLRQDASKLAGWGAQDTVLISRKPFTSDDIARVRLGLGKQIQAVYLPGDPPANAFGQFLLSSNPQAFLAAYPYDVAPVGDDRPFFFYTVQPRDLWAFAKRTAGGSWSNGASADYKINRAVPLLFELMAVSIAATALILMLPGLVLRSQIPKQKGVLAFLWYFLCLGAGYILIQVALIQKFVLLLGHPTYALTVIVFSMLVASGTGSYFSRRVVGEGDSKLSRVLALIAVLIALLAFGSSSLTTAAAAWPLGAKMAITALAIAPAAFLMGMPFPSGLRRLEHLHPPSVRWAWSLNAAASVLGSAGAIFLAIYIGLRATLLAGGAMYLCALAVIVFTRKQFARRRGL